MAVQTEVLYATTCCAGVTRRFHKITFRGFFSERELVDFLHMHWRHFCQILFRTLKTYTFLHLSEQIDKYLSRTFRIK
jgi:hypothetical protein